MTLAATKVLTAHIPLPMAEKIDLFAERLERSRGWIMKQALSLWLDQEAQKEQLILAALSDVDEGRLIDQAVMEAWADSLATDAPLPEPQA